MSIKDIPYSVVQAIDKTFDYLDAKGADAVQRGFHLIIGSISPGHSWDPSDPQEIPCRSISLGPVTPIPGIIKSAVFQLWGETP
jgi:hypothetical protein